MSSADIEAMNQIYEQGKMKAESDIRELESKIKDSKTLTLIQAANFDLAQKKLFKYVYFYQAKRDKEYKKDGMTWAELCEAAGENVRNVDRILKEIKPLYDNFLGQMSNLIDVPFNKIRYLGRSINKELDQMSKIENGHLIIDGNKIPLTTDNQEEIATAIDTLIETHKEEKQVLQKSLEKHEKKLDENVKEETKGLSDERDHAIAARDQYKEEVERLKPFDITEKDVSWSLEHIEKMHDLCLKFGVAARKFIMDERLEEEMTLQAKIEEKIYFMYQLIKDLRKDWDNEYWPDSED